MNNKGIYYAKILLFGEYSVICNSMGLSIPYSHFKGELSFVNEDRYTDLNFAQKSNKILAEFLDYVLSLNKKSELLCNFDISKFKADIEKGLFFESTIPQGFGLGSSGALIAAIYDNYVNGKMSNSRKLSMKQILELKKIFAQLESFFHGTSSGIDPLNSYLKMPLLINEKSEVNIVGLPRKKYSGDKAIFLINTFKPRKTEALVNYFLDKCNTSNTFSNKIHSELIPLTNSCIQSLIEGQTTSFFNSLSKLSLFQLNNLNHMILEPFKDIWRKGIETGDYYLKLCGAGGGGFLLGFSNNFEKTRQYFEANDFEIIPVFKSNNIRGSSKN